MISFAFQVELFQSPAANTALTEAWVCLSAAPLPSPHLLCYSQRPAGKTERIRCPYMRWATGQCLTPVVLTFPLLRDCASSFPAQVTWRGFENDAQKRKENESQKSSDFL